MPTTKDFHLGDILSITTHRLVSPRLMDGVHEILNWMTQDDLMSHQLPRAAVECGGPLTGQLPDAVAAIKMPDKFEDEEHVGRWLAEQVALHGEFFPVSPLVLSRHIDPFDELAGMRPDMPIGIAVGP